jgi:hypothetical protein
MPLLESVLLNLKWSQPLRSFLNELLLLVLIVPGRAIGIGRSLTAPPSHTTVRPGHVHGGSAD